jgi:leader peptidase (prepilin peptidase)/N-methyltransferase
MTTDSSKTTSNLINDLKSIPSPVFYIFAAVAVFAGIFVCGFNAVGIATCVFLLLLAACASADIKAGIVPDLIVILIAVFGVINFIIIEGFSFPGLISHLIGAVCVSVPMLIISLIIKKAFGGGDIKLSAAAGLYLGWKFAITGIAVGLFISGIYALILIISKKAKLKSTIRIAPCLALGFGLASLFGELFANFLFIW